MRAAGGSRRKKLNYNAVATEASGAGMAFYCCPEFTQGG